MTWLVLALGFLAVASWLSAFLLVRKARQRPRIGALTERAVLAVALSFFGTTSLVLTLNRDLDVARVLFSLSALGLLAISPLWLVLYAANRLGDGGHGQ